MLQLCIQEECVEGLSLTLPWVLQFYSWSSPGNFNVIPMAPHKIRGSHILAHSQLQSLMNYATEAVFTLLYSLSLSLDFQFYICLHTWQEEGVCTVVNIYILCLYDVCASLGVVCTRVQLHRGNDGQLHSL